MAQKGRKEGRKAKAVQEEAVVACGLGWVSQEPQQMGVACEPCHAQSRKLQEPSLRQL